MDPNRSREAVLTVIQHNTQSLLHQAVQRYLRTCDRIDRRFRRALIRSVAILFLALAAACVIALLASHQRAVHL